MTCQKCGFEVPEGAAVCEKCGTAVQEYMPLQAPRATKFCSHCGAKVLLEAEICPQCGCRLVEKKTKKKATLLLLAVVGVFLIAAIAAVMMIREGKINPFLDQNTKYALRVANGFKEALYEPDSMEVEEVYVWITDNAEDTSEDEEKTLARVYIKYSGQNLLGGTASTEGFAYIYEDETMERITLDSLKKSVLASGVDERLVGLVDIIYKNRVEDIIENGVEVDAEEVNKLLKQ